MTDLGPRADQFLDGAAVVVTGVGNAGQVGETVAQAFAARGAVVHCLGRSPAVEDRAAELRAVGGRATAHIVDLTDFAATASIAATIAAAHDGRVAAVAGLAGGFALSGPVDSSDPQVYANQVAINLTSAYATARAFMPAVRAAHGTFIFVASAGVLGGGKVAGMSAYAMAKGGLVQLVRAIAQDERGHGVRALAVAPTAVRTSTNIASMGSGVSYVEREEIAEAIVALCGPSFRRVSGQVIALA